MGKLNDDWEMGMPPKEGMYYVETFDKPIYLRPVPKGTYPDIDEDFITWGWDKHDDPESIEIEGITVDTIKWKYINNGNVQ